MRRASSNHNPSLVSDLESLAGLYRTVFRMMGRKARYGRIWPPEAEMAGPDEYSTVAPPPVIESARSPYAEVSSRD
jgi:hypothetical protein